MLLGGGGGEPPCSSDALLTAAGQSRSQQQRSCWGASSEPVASWEESKLAESEKNGRDAVLLLKMLL